MIFLNPTILLGLLATAIPVFLHFLNLRKIKKIEFSTLHFLKEIQKSKIKKIKIKQIILLLIRILIIIFLVFAFARPTLESTTVNMLDSDAKTTSFILLDNSNSMGRIENDGTLLNQSKEAIKKIYKQYKGTNNFFLIPISDYDGEPIKIESESEIDGVKLSNKTVVAEDALKKSFAKLSESINLNKELYFFSDFQKSTFYKKEPDTSLGVTKIGNVYIFNIGNGKVANLSLENTVIDNQIIELNKDINIKAYVKSSQGYQGGSSIVSLFFANKRVAQKQCNLKKEGSETISFKTGLREYGLTEIVSEIDDDIEYDNKYFTFLFIPNKIKVLVVSENNDELKYFYAALKTSFNSNLELKKITPKQINSVNLKNYSVVIFNSEKGTDNFELKNYLQSGGNLILFPELSNAAKVLGSSFNQRGSRIINYDNSYVEFGNIDFSHPIFNGVFNKSNEGISSPRIKKYFYFGLNKRGRTIIALENGSNLLSEYSSGNGKILVWSIKPTSGWSDFPYKNSFAPIMVRSIVYLSSSVKNMKTAYPGEKLFVNISGRKSNRIKLIKPSGNIEFLNVKSGNRKRFAYAKTDEIGNYKFYSSEELIDVKSVNSNPAESVFEKININSFVDKIKKNENNVVKLSLKTDYLKIINSEKYGSELWKLFILIALLLSIAEMLIAKSSKRDIVSLRK